MIIDADSHYAPVEFADQFSDSTYAQQYKDMHRPFSLESTWTEHYNQIKDPAWPDAGRIVDFHLLPIEIRRELHDTHTQAKHIVITDDLSRVIVCNPRHQNPATIQEYRDVAKHIIKTNHQLISPSTASMRMVNVATNNIAIESMKLWNRKALALANEYSDFDVNAWLALQNFPASYEELNFVLENNFFGIYLGDIIPWGLINEMDTLFKLCEQHRMPVYIHPDPVAPPPAIFQWNVDDPKWVALKENWPGVNFTWLVGLASLFVSGVFEKYPNLRVVIAERGLNWVNEVRKFMLANNWPDPIDTIQKNIWFAIDIEEDNFIKNANIIGYDRLMFSTDYPHNDPGGSNQMNDVDCINELLATNKITQEQYDLLTHKNYLKLKNRLD